MYKVETHLNTTYVSRCGKLDAQALIQGYKAAGYSAIMVTDHYNRITFDYLGISTTAPGDKIGPFLEGYRKMVEAGEREGIRVFKGAELRFDESGNDYLLYGFADDLLADPEAIFRMGIASFSAYARSQGALIIQAHPYRKTCTPAIACYLDGVEVRNRNPRHENHNDMAEAYARQFGLLELGGSDCHRTEDIAASGILTYDLPEDSFAMARVIRSRRYTLL